MKPFRGERLYQIFSFAIIGLLSLASAYPIVYVVSMSLVSEQEWIQRNGFIFIPYHPTFLAYERLFVGSVFTNALTVSVLRAAVGTALTLTMTMIGAYVVSRKRLPGRKVFLFLILVTVLFNSGLIPTYLVVKDLHLLDTFWSLIVPGLIDSWSLLVLKQFFEGIPQEIEESAEVDGVNDWSLMTRIILPMSKPALAAIGLFIAVAHWNSWFDAFIYINRPDWMPLQLIMRNMFANANIGSDFNPTSVLNPAQRVSTESLKMAVAVIGTVPILLVYPFLQKHFAKGMYLGAVKG
ncbi:carbohydrate ABC transporter permease [Cohnella ginsengisoli]|uniref:Carbohydrate ABC transporter permease n=1 Tax=Cohnella ginsengisoli TaxID=425004 RepID=A0A9X4KIY5_9BACL|nr:carbohydrate ABC transporter permease [Cohnella ginsengisoli]MDG0792354.1 carbohydrate ABC transporter permease [Cohnella ginsengisoli]